MVVKRKKNRYNPDKGDRRGLIRGILKHAAGLTAFFTGVVLLSAGLAHSYHALLGSPWFVLQEVHISGLQNVDRSQVLNAMGVPRNASLLRLKMAAMAESVEKLPWVKSAVVRLDPPRRLVVEVEERKPLGIVTADVSYLVDQDGKIFLNVNREAFPGLICLQGFEELALRLGEYLPMEPFETLQELQSSVARQEHLGKGEGVHDFRWDPVEGISFQLPSRPVLIHLGSDAFDKKIRRLKKVLALLEEHGWQDAVTRIDLDYQNRAYVEGNFPAPVKS